MHIDAVSIFIVKYHIAGFFEGENFCQFHELIVIHENFTLKLFTLGINTKWHCLSVSKLSNTWKKIIVLVIVMLFC